MATQFADKNRFDAHKRILNEDLVPYEQDEVTRLIMDEHNSTGFEAISHMKACKSQPMRSS